ncbi:MAG: hypothetical protein ACOC80_13570 [Petrotogales bacterium]
MNKHKRFIGMFVICLVIAIASGLTPGIYIHGIALAGWLLILLFFYALSKGEIEIKFKEQEK